MKKVSDLLPLHEHPGVRERNLRHWGLIVSPRIALPRFPQFAGRTSSAQPGLLCSSSAASNMADMTAAMPTEPEGTAVSRSVPRASSAGARASRERKGACGLKRNASKTKPRTSSSVPSRAAAAARASSSGRSSRKSRALGNALRSRVDSADDEAGDVPANPYRIERGLGRAPHSHAPREHRVRQGLARLRLRDEAGDRFIQPRAESGRGEHGRVTHARVTIARVQENVAEESTQPVQARRFIRPTCAEIIRDQPPGDAARHVADDIEPARRGLFRDETIGPLADRLLEPRQIFTTAGQAHDRDFALVGWPFFHTEEKVARRTVHFWCVRRDAEVPGPRDSTSITSG